MAPARVTILAVISLFAMRFATLRHSASRLHARATFARSLFKTLLVAGRLLVLFLRRILGRLLALLLRLLLAGLFRTGLHLATVHATA